MCGCARFFLIPPASATEFRRSDAILGTTPKSERTYTEVSSCQRTQKRIY